MDYVEFHFNGRILRALASPTLEFREATLRFPDPGSRDALCALIGNRVEHIDVTERHIKVAFVLGGTLTIPLGNDLGPEGAHFVPGSNLPIQVY